jgi:hypothetical protein
MRRLLLHVLHSFMHGQSTFTTSECQARTKHHALDKFEKGSWWTYKSGYSDAKETESHATSRSRKVAECH